MKPAEIQVGCAYKGKTGKSRKVFGFKNADVYYREHGQFAKRKTSLMEFAHWATEQIDLRPSTRMALVK